MQETEKYIVIDTKFGKLKDWFSVGDLCEKVEAGSYCFLRNERGDVAISSALEVYPAPKTKEEVRILEMLYPQLKGRIKWRFM